MSANSWVAEVEVLLTEARRHQDFRAFGDSLPPIEAVVGILDREDKEIAEPALRAEALGLHANVICRRATAPDLAEAERRLEEAFALAAQLDETTAQTSVLMGRLWNVRGIVEWYFGTPNRYHAALFAYDRAIELRSALDLDRAEFRNHLASSWNNKGNALRALGSPDDLKDALVAYDRAIELRNTLDLDRAEFRNALAGSWSGKGNALHALGSPDDLKAALVTYDRAIELYSALDLDRAEFRNDLANSWTNKGNALQALSNPDDLKAALVAYDRATELYSALDLDRAEFRNDLARSWNNKGNALQVLGSSGDLNAALVAYDRAIELRSALDLDRAEFRNDLAGSWNNKGMALHTLGGPDNLGVSISSYGQAWALLRPLVADPASLYLPAADLTLDTAVGFASALRHLGRWEEITDLGDDALIVARYLEQNRLIWGRKRRERIFERAIEAYLRAGMIGTLPELILEELGPDSPGSAGDSPAMHRAAARAVDGAVQLSIANGNVAGVGPLLGMQNELSRLRTRYFGGSAEGARLRAELALRRGASGEALAITTDHVSRRPLDPEGYLVRAGFLLRSNRKPEAKQDLTRAGRLAIVASRPDDPGELARIVEIARSLLQLKLQDIVEGLVTRRGLTTEAVVTHFDAPRVWLVSDLPGVLLADDAAAPLGLARKDAWRATLVPAFAALAGTIDAERARYIAAQEDGRELELREQIRSEILNRVEALFDAIGALLPRVLRDFMDGMASAIRHAIETYGEEPKPEDLDHFVETVIGDLRRLTGSLSREVMDEQANLMARQLGPEIWDTLDEFERRYLAGALLCKSNPVLIRFAALELGCAVEAALVHRLLLPVRAFHRDNKLPVPPPVEGEWASEKLHLYLSGERQTMMLGEIARVFGKATSRLGKEAGEADVYAPLSKFLSDQPGGSRLHGLPEHRLKSRRRTVNDLADARNRVAHLSKPEDVPDEALIATLWHDVVNDREDGFFRYFPAVFVKTKEAL